MKHKNLSAFALSTLLLFSLAACGKKEKETKAKKSGQSKEVTSSETSETMETNGMINPWQEVDHDTLKNEIGFNFGVPVGATDVKYFWFEGERIAQMTFTLNDVGWTARAQVSSSLQDISGMYYEWPECPTIFTIENNGCIQDGNVYECITESEKATLGMWFFEGAEHCYSLTLSCVTTPDTIVTNPANEVFLLENAGF